MRYFPGKRVLVVLVFSCLVLFVFLLLAMPNPISNVSAVEANGVGVYWDNNCSNEVSSIDYGALTPASTKNIILYIRNEVEEPAYFFLSTTDWNPPEAYQYLSLAWDYSGQWVEPNEMLQTTLTLSVSASIEGISSFSHVIIITASYRFPFDVDGDGIVDIFDLAKTAAAFGSQLEDNPETPQDESGNWNPNADISPPYGIIDIYDLLAVTLHFGETHP